MIGTAGPLLPFESSHPPTRYPAAPLAAEATVAAALLGRSPGPDTTLLSAHIRAALLLLPSARTMAAPPPVREEGGP